MINKTYQIATEINGGVYHLKIPKSTFEKANEQAIRLRQMSPRAIIMVINTESV